MELNYQEALFLKEIFGKMNGIQIKAFIDKAYPDIKISELEEKQKILYSIFLKSNDYVKALKILKQINIK